MNEDLVSYYKLRAAEYEKIYSKPERQLAINEATTILQQLFSGKTVFEVACGTGYWTEKIAVTCNEILATDINEAVLAIAKQKNYENTTVKFEVADVFTYQAKNNFECLFAGFIWSHIKQQDLDLFIEQINKNVVPGGLVVIMDNKYVEGSNTPLSNTDAYGNTYQTRKLEDGSSHLVLKNFPSKEFLEEKIMGAGINFQYYDLNYFWIISYHRT